MRVNHTRAGRVVLPAVLGLMGACDSSGSSGPGDQLPPAPRRERLPVRYEIVVNVHAMKGDTVRFRTGRVDTVRVTFYDADGQPLTALERRRYSALRFPGTVQATVTHDPAAHFTHYVANAERPGTTGVLTLGYGRDTEADDVSFPISFRFH